MVIGTIEARKNHVLLLRVWAKLAETMGDACPDLVVIGQRGWEANDAFSLLDMARHVHGRVLELGQRDDPTRCAWLNGARALLMPSFVEGFGLPVIEALQRHVPVIASDLPVFHEIAGDIPRYCDPHDTLAWADAIAAYCGNHPDRNRQIERTASFLAPTWACHFRALDIWLRAFA